MLKPEDNPGWLDVAGEQVDPKIGLVLKSKLVFFPENGLYIFTRPECLTGVLKAIPFPGKRPLDFYKP